MKVLYFDCFSGISGDMTLGALLDLGADQELFRAEMAKLGLGGYEIRIEKMARNAIMGTDVTVIVNDDGDHHSRNLKDIQFLINGSDLKQNVKEFSCKVFGEIARAEGKVHDMPADEVHFHEVGAVDSIVDIVGVAICMDILGIKKVFSSPVHDGRGFVECRHGIMPVPVPAVMEMLTESRIPFVTEDVNTELVTPTGMGLLKCLTGDFGAMPAMMIDRIGYGHGKRETGRLNSLRVVMGTLFEEDAMLEEIAVLETNLDNMSPELMGYAMESLFQKGALDVYFTPIYMKKNRPATMLTVLCGPDTEKILLETMMKETGTLGVRRSIMQRYCMDRTVLSVETPLGSVRVKMASMGDLRKFAPEYEDCREIARKTGMPLKNIYEMACESAKRIM